MFDDILNAAAPAGGDAAAPAGGAPAARARVNGRAGTRHSSLSITRLQLGLVRSRVKQFESRVRLSAQSFSQHVAGVCSSNARPNDSHQMAVCDQGPGKITIKNSKQGSRSADFATCCDYGVLSGIKGQASIIAGRINADTRSVISINGFDDASMWTKDPAPAKDRASGA